MASGAALSLLRRCLVAVPLTLEFSATVQGDSINGTVVFAALGSSSFSGTRA